MNLSESFAEAYKSAKLFEDKYSPTISAFNEIKKILTDNFIITEQKREPRFVFEKESFLFFFSRKRKIESYEYVQSITPKFTDMEYEKLIINDHPWIYIPQLLLLMSVGTMGEFKDKLIFIPCTIVQRKTIDTYSDVILKYNMGNENVRIFREKDCMNEVQFFSHVIRNFKNYLKNKLT